MEEIKAAEIRVLIAADHWARETMREDRSLKNVETKLLDAVLYYLKIVKEAREKPIDIPRPAHVPSDLAKSISHSELPTARYSDKPTVPTPAGGFEAVRVIELRDSDYSDYINNEDDE